MNDTSYPKGPVNISKHPLLKRAYDLCREIDTLPASEEQTFVVTKASQLLNFLQCYFEEKGFPPPPAPELCKHNVPVDDICDECAKEMGLSRCEQCDEIAWDGRICHSCGMKEI